MCARQFDAQLAEQAEALLPICWRMCTTCLQLTVTNTYVAMSAGTHLLSECIVPHQQNISLNVLWKICSVYVHSPTVISADDLLRGCQQILSCFCHRIAVANQLPIKAHTHHTLSQAFAYAGVASSSRGPHHTPTPFKFVQVLAALGRPDAALAVLRASAHVSSADNQSSEEAFQEAQTALSIRLQCGVFTEACSEV